MCKLSELFGDKTSENSLKKVLIVDGHNIAYRCLYSDIYRNPDDITTFALWKHAFLNDIFNVIAKFNPDTVVLAFDEKGSWRYNIYPNYKAHRKSAKAKSKLPIDWELFFRIFDEFINDIKKTFTNIYVIKAPHTEGDDIIGVCANEIFKTDDITIVSNDGDMRQLLVNPNVHQYDPKSREIVECMNPAIELEMKILTGDHSDFITGVRYGVGKMTAEKIIKTGLDDFVDNLKYKITRKMKRREWMSDEDTLLYCLLPIGEDCLPPEDNRPVVTKDEIEYFIKKDKAQVHINYKRNINLIDLKKIPNDIKNEIINIYTTHKDENFKPTNGSEIMSFFMKHQLTQHMSNWNQVSRYFKELI